MVPAQPRLSATALQTAGAEPGSAPFVEYFFQMALLTRFRCAACFARLSQADILRTIERALVHRLDEEPHVNPSTETKEFSLSDPDGYYVTISALSAA